MIMYRLVPMSSLKHSRSFIHWAECLCIGLLACGLIEGIWGTLQLCGVIDSGHPRYPVTGSFYNPGPYGCFLGCFLPLAIWLYQVATSKWLRIIATISILITALLLPGGMSRTGWIAATIGTAVVLVGMYRSKIKQISRGKLAFVVIILGMVIAGCCLGAYHLKPDSADGRLLMWKIAARAAVDCPLTGVGWENVAGTYGVAQELYFSSGEATAREEMLAGTPAYVFNEYLQIAIAYGIPAATLFTGTLVASACLFWKTDQYGLAGLIAALMVVCFASYPLQFWEFKILIGLAVFAAFTNIATKSMRYISVAAWTCLCAGFCLVASTVDIDSEFMRAQRAQHIGHYQESNIILRQILHKTSDPMPLNLMGKNYQAMGIRDSAEHSFCRAAVRVPNRLYPHYLLMNLYADSPSDSLKLRHQAHILLTKQPKTHSTAVEQMRQKAHDLLTNHTYAYESKAPLE